LLKKGMKIKILSFVTIILASLFMTTPAFSDVPLEDPIFAEGAKAIRDMHGLNMLGLTGDLITIFVAPNEASKAAEVFYQNKWRPGDEKTGPKNAFFGNRIILQNILTGLMQKRQFCLSLNLQLGQYPFVFPSL